MSRKPKEPLKRGDDYFWVNLFHQCEPPIWASAAEYATLFEIVRHANNKTGKTFVSYPAIARRTQQHARSVTRLTGAMALRGIISVHLHGYDGRLNFIEVLFDDPAVRERAVREIEQRNRRRKDTKRTARLNRRKKGPKTRKPGARASDKLSQVTRDEKRSRADKLTGDRRQRVARPTTACHSVTRQVVASSSDNMSHRTINGTKYGTEGTGTLEELRAPRGELDARAREEPAAAPQHSLSEINRKAIESVVTEVLGRDGMREGDEEDVLLTVMASCECDDALQASKGWDRGDVAHVFYDLIARREAIARCRAVVDRSESSEDASRSPRLRARAAAADGSVRYRSDGSKRR